MSLNLLVYLLFLIAVSVIVFRNYFSAYVRGWMALAFLLGVIYFPFFNSDFSPLDRFPYFTHMLVMALLTFFIKCENCGMTVYSIGSGKYENDDSYSLFQYSYAPFVTVKCAKCGKSKLR